MYSAATTVDEYLDELSEDRRASMETVRKVILDNISEGYEETMQFGMIGYVIPLERYPVTYNGKALQAVALCSQKNYMSLYLMNVYGDQKLQEWFEEEYRASGKKLNMGKACIRFKKPEDLPMDLIAKAISLTSGGAVHRDLRGGPGQDKQAGQALQVEPRLTVGSFVNPLPN